MATVSSQIDESSVAASMTSFGWKRKAGAKVNKQQTEAFNADSKNEETEADDLYDWLSMAPRKTAIPLEDKTTKAERLKAEGATLAESERYWEAIKKWDEAIQLLPQNFRILDMKAQALMAVGEMFPALQAAERTVKLAPNWWDGYQTLGRALINVGEVRMALKTFSRAIHLNPGETELWEEDLKWALSLIERHRYIQWQKQAEENCQANANKPTVTVRELTDTPGGEEEDNESLQISRRVSNGPLDDKREPRIDNNAQGNSIKMKWLPTNYVHMRDPT